MIRYMEALASTATDAYVQKHTCITVWNHSPVSGMPYWHMLIRIVPDLRHQLLLIEWQTCTYETTWKYISTAPSSTKEWTYLHKLE